MSPVRNRRLSVLARGLALALVVLGRSQTPADDSPPGPRSPQEALQSFALHPQCHIELVAAEPDVVDPVHIAFAPDGKLWVVEYSDYPNGPQQGQPGSSRIRVLSDPDGDGRYTNPVTFAQQLLFANGLMHWRDGVIVTTDGKVLFLRDTNGDGRADETQEWFAGFATENPQLRCNHPTLGLDGRIYIANGLRGGSIVPGKDFPWKSPHGRQPEPVSISGMDFRFDPFTGTHAAISGNGQFGLTFNDLGDRFVCSNRNPCKQLVLEDEFLKRNPHLRVPRVFEDVSPAGEASKLFPISRSWTTSNLHANQFTAACGVTIYRGSALPAEFYGNSFTCEPTGNLVHRDVLSPSGPTYTSRPGREGIEFLASTDEWFRPVNLAHGPDGALYVVDMYRAVIEHPQYMPEELKRRPDLVRGNDRGRIWRIVAMGEHDEPEALIPFEKRSTGELVTSLTSANCWTRETAHRLLLERRDPSCTGPLQRLVEEGGDHRATIHALWLLHRLELLTAGDLKTVLGRDDLPAKEHAVRLVGDATAERVPHGEDARTAAIAGLKPQLEALLRKLAPDVGPGDPRGRLVFQLLWTCPAGRALAGSAESPDPAESDPPLAPYADVLENWGDNIFYRAAVFHGLGEATGDLASLLLHRELNSTGEKPAARLAALHQLCELVGRSQQHAEVSRLTEQAFSEDARPQKKAARLTQVRTELLLGLADGLRSRDRMLERLSRLAAAPRRRVEATFAAARQTAADNGVSEAVRADAVRLLAFDTRPQTRQFLIGLLDDPAMASVAVDTLGEFPDEEVTDVLLARYSRSTPAVRTRTLQVLTSSSKRIARLVEELESGRIRPIEIDPATTQRLVRFRDPQLRERARAVIEQNRPEDRTAVLAAYADCLKLQPDLSNGREVFKQNCAICHRIGEMGVNVAPDISDSRTKTAEYLLTHILDPNLAIDNNYFSYTIVDVQGRIHTGIIDSETSNAVTLKQPEGKTVTIPRAEIDEMKSNGVSLMPVGLEKKIDQRQMADLVGFIKNWRYLGGQVPGLGSP